MYKYVINPLADSALDLEAFYFLGILLAFCLKANKLLSIDLPDMFWAQMFNHPLALNDLKEIDEGAFYLIEELKQLPNANINSENFDNYYQLKFEIESLNEIISPIDEEGNSRKVQFDEIKEFI